MKKKRKINRAFNGPIAPRLTDMDHVACQRIQQALTTRSKWAKR